MLKILLIFFIAYGILFSQTKSDSVNVDYLKTKNSIEYKTPTFLRVTGQFLVGNVLGFAGVVIGKLHKSLVPIGWAFASTAGVYVVGGTKGSSYWWPFAAGSAVTISTVLLLIDEKDPFGLAAGALLGMLTSVTAEIIVYWLTKDCGETDAETNVKITQRKLDIRNFQYSIKEYTVTQPDISLPVIQFSF